MSNSKAQAKKDFIDNLLKTEMQKKELFGLNRRRLSGTSSLSSGGLITSGGGSTTTVTGQGDNLGNHIATQDLDMSQQFIIDYIGWDALFGTGNGHLHDFIDTNGVQHFIDEPQSYRWWVYDNNIFDYASILELNKLGIVVGSLFYGINTQDNYIQMGKRHYPGAAPTDSKRIYVDETSKLLSLTNDAGDILPLEQQYITINYVIDGGGSVVTTGSKGGLWADFNFEILYATVTADTYSGSIAVRVDQINGATYPGGAIQMGSVTLTSGYSATINVAAAGWNNTSVYGESSLGAATRWLRFVVQSASGVRLVTVSLKCRRLT